MRSFTASTQKKRSRKWFVFFPPLSVSVFHQQQPSPTQTNAQFFLFLWLALFTTHTHSPPHSRTSPNRECAAPTLSSFQGMDGIYNPKPRFLNFFGWVWVSVRIKCLLRDVYVCYVRLYVCLHVVCVWVCSYFSESFFAFFPASRSVWICPLIVTTGS